MTGTPDRADSKSTKRIQIDELLAGAQEIVIVHQGKEYTLRITARGRLILTR